MSKPSHPSAKFSRRARLTRATDVLTRVAVETLEDRRLFAAGAIDTTFGTGGVATAIPEGIGGPGESVTQAYGATVEPGGKLVVVGTTKNYDTALPTTGAPDPKKYTQNFAITKFLRDGSVDTFQTTDFNDGYDFATGAAVGSDNSIVVVGNTIKTGSFDIVNEHVALVRYQFDGLVLKKQVEDDAQVLTEQATCVALQSDGKILVGGWQFNSSTGEDMAIWRYNADLTPDTTFGTNGVDVIPFQSYSDDEVNAIAVQPDGNIVFAGFSDTSTFDQYTGHRRFVVGRLNTAGALDTSFGGTGFAEGVDFGNTDATANGVAVQPDGKIVAAGRALGQSAILRYNTDGSLDATFGGRGNVFLAGVLAKGVGVQSDGKIVVGGLDAATHLGYATGRVNSDGKPDGTYGTNGVSTSTLGGQSALAATMVFQPQDGKIDVVGTSVATVPSGGGPTFTGTSEQFEVGRFNGDSVPPTATLAASNVAVAGGTTYQFQVTYADNTAVNFSSIANGNVRVTGPNGFNQLATLVGTSVSADGPNIVATYQITAPGGTFDTHDDGTYVVRVLANQVSDTGGNFVPARVLGNFLVNVGPSAAIPPTASLTAADLQTGGGTTYQFTVKYSDNNAVNVSTIDNNDIRVTGPNFFNQLATLVSVDNSSNGTPRTATYQITAPGGSWDISDNGTYAVAVQANQVADTDTAPNYVNAGTIGQFTVAVPSGTGGPTNPGSGTGQPTATLNSFPAITSPVTGVDFTVTYTSAVPLNLSTLTANDNAVTVTGPHLFAQNATFVSAQDTSAGAGTTVVVTYHVNAPDGTFDPFDTGAYTVTMNQTQVSDTDGIFVAPGAIGTFNSAVPTTSISGGILTIVGTDFANSINVSTDGTGIRVVVDNNAQTIPFSGVNGIQVLGLAGADTISIGTGVGAATVLGGAGADTIFGGPGDDSLSGGPGPDLILGSAGNDTIAGNGGADTLLGQGGNDSLSGGNGLDSIRGGGGNDTLDAGAGPAFLAGGGGDDTFFARNGVADTIDGGLGNNSAQIDNGLDVILNSSIQNLLA